MTVSSYGSGRTIGEFISAAAAKQPTPGGGSVTALVGALAAAMGEMVVNYSVGRKDLSQHEAELREALAEFGRARTLLLALMVEDQAAYEAFSRIRKEGGAQDPRFPAALLACIRVPQAMAATGVAVLELCDRVGDRVNRHLISDLAVCAELAMATVRCASYNVRVNLGDLPEAADRQIFERFIARTRSSATALVQRVLPKIWSRG